MGFKVIQPASAGRFRAIKPAKKPGVADEVMGALTTLNRSIPLADELADGVQAGVDIVTGRSKPGEAWRKARARSKAASQDFKARRPLAAAGVEGVGLAAQAAPALATGGGSAVVSPGLRGLMGASARSAVSAGLGAQASGLASEGSLSQRQKTANDATLPAVAIGGAIPVGIAAAGAGRRATANFARTTGRVAARTANRVSGGQLLDPKREAAKRLGEALKADGLGPQEVRRALEEWQATGASPPALMDLAGENTRALLRSAASKPGAARNAAVRYANTVTADVQDNAINRTRGLTTDERLLPEIEDEIGGRIRSASAFDEAAPGSGGAQVSDALNRRYDAGQAQVREAYRSAREVADGTSLPREQVPQLASRLREAVRDYDLQRVPAVGRAMSRFDEVGGTTGARDLFDVRSQLSTLRSSNDAMEASAAGAAVRELDSFIDDAVQTGAFDGDPAAIEAWRGAIAQRRQFGEAFEGDDLIARLTGRERHGAGRAQAISPEDASNTIFGRSGVLNRPDTVRDLTRLRDMLGPDSAEWQAVQREGVSRLLGRDAGTEQFGQAWQGFARQNPQLADLLMPQQMRSALAASQAQIGEAVADRGAVQTGRTVMRAAPDRLARDTVALGDRRALAQVGAAREIEEAIGRPAEGSTGTLNRIATSTNAERNLETLFGPEEAGRYRDAIGREIDRVGNARFISPNTGSQTALREADDALIDLPPMSKVGIAKALFDKLRRGVTLTDAEREALVELGTTLVRSGDDIPRIPTTPEAMRLLSPAARSKLSQALAAGEGAALAN